MEPIDKILKEASADILTDETTKLMKEAFEQEVEKRVSDRLQFEIDEIDKKHADEITKLVESIDTKHSEQYQTLLEANDADHTSKMKTLVSEMDKSYTNRLKLVKEHYEVKQEEEMEQFKNSILESIDQHIDNVLDEKIPVDVFEKAAAAYLTKNQPVNESKKPTAKKTTLLESLVRGFSADKRAFVTAKFNGKDDTSVKKNFDYVVGLYEKRQQNQKQVIAENAIRKSIDSQSEVTLSENNAEVSANQNEISPMMNSYIIKATSF